MQQNRDQVDRQFAEWLAKKVKCSGMSFNDALQNKRDFHNPSMVKRLLEYAGLEECQSNGPYLSDKPSFDWERVSANQRKEYDRENVK